MLADMHWFRWHHGTVSDPKLSLIASQAGVTLAEVLAVWAWLLESASEAEERGNPGFVDFEVVDHGLGLAPGHAQAIHARMVGRGLIDAEGRLVAWARRQPKREREDPGAAERQRNKRARDAGELGSKDGVTPRHAKSRQKTPRGEERREEEKTHTACASAGEAPAGEGRRVCVSDESMKSGDTSPAAMAWQAMQAAGLSDAASGDPEVAALLQRGGTAEQLGAAAAQAVARGKGVAYALGIVQNRLKQASSMAAGPPAVVVAWDSGRASIEAKGIEVGVGAWDEAAAQVGRGESFPVYLARVRSRVEAQRGGSG